jgi:DeoR/GlpR family transcriptional regulator of sugar metabolism
LKLQLEYRMRVPRVKGRNMLQEDRFLKILEYISDKNTATFSELKDVLGVSEGTVRRDLSKMEKNGMLKIVRGGVVSVKDDLSKQAFNMRSIEHREEKRDLATALREIIVDGQAIAMNGGTTHIETAKYLAKNYTRLTIITNNLNAVETLKENKDFRIIITGGIHDPKENVLFGKQCINSILSYNVDMALLAVNAISLENGITDFRLEEISILNAFMKSSRMNVVVADHSKFDRVACMNVCEIETIDCILTDRNINPNLLEKYRSAGVRIITPTEEQGIK